MKYGLTIVTGPSIKRETTMEQFIGLDVSLKDGVVAALPDGIAMCENRGVYSH